MTIGLKLCYDNLYEVSKEASKWVYLILDKFK